MSYIDKQVVEIRKDKAYDLHRIGVYKRYDGSIDISIHETQNICTTSTYAYITLTKREARTLMKGLQKAIQKRKR